MSPLVSVVIPVFNEVATLADLHLRLARTLKDVARPSEIMGDPILVIRGRALRAKTTGQRRYVDSIRKNPIVFAIGPAGTGKCIAADSLVVFSGNRSGETTTRCGA